MSAKVDFRKALEVVDSKYLLVMSTARRSRQLVEMQQKEKILKDVGDYSKLPEKYHSIRELTKEEREELSLHKPIVASLEELEEKKLRVYFEEEV